MSWLKGLFSGGGIVDSIEKVACEWIETDKEKAEAKTIMIKALDPNGAMRRQLSRDVTQVYKVYLYITLILIILEFFGIGAAQSVPMVGEQVNAFSVATATDKLKELFLPITSLFGVIVSASFGVNYANVKKSG